MAYADPNDPQTKKPLVPGAMLGMMANAGKQPDPGNPYATTNTVNPFATTNTVNPDAYTNTANPDIGTGADPYGSPKPRVPGAILGDLADGNPISTTNAEQPTSPDPFTAMGGGTFVNGGWIPNNNPAAIAAARAASGTPGTAPAPTANTTAPATANTGQPTSPDPFTAMGGGTFINGGWIPNNNPAAIAAARAASPGQGNVLAGDPADQPGTTNAGTIAQQAANAQTYSNAPGAAPTANTTNQGTQDVLRNSLLRQATQGTAVDRNDPNFKQQLDPFVAQQDRARRQYEGEQAERLSAQGLGNSGQMGNERRLGAEKAGQASGMMESQLVTRELENRRNEIQNALSGLKGMVSDDQSRALQKQLAELDAAIKREGIAAGVNTSANDLALRDKLGTGALNIDMLRALLQNQQFGDRMGFDVTQQQNNWDWLQRGNSQ